MAVEIPHAWLKIEVIIFNADEIFPAAEYNPAALSPSTAVRQYLSKLELIHQNIELGIIGIEYNSISFATEPFQKFFVKNFQYLPITKYKAEERKLLTISEIKYPFIPHPNTTKKIIFKNAVKKHIKTEFLTIRPTLSIVRANIEK